MARIRRTAVQTLEFKIEKAEERASKTRAAHKKAIDVKITGCFAAPVRPQGSTVPDVRDAAFR